MSKFWSLKNAPRFSSGTIVLLVAGALIFAPVSVRSEIVAPYKPDNDTLHLWHFDESNVPVLDAVRNGTDLGSLEGGATLGNESYHGLAGFGTALCTYNGNPNIEPGAAGQECFLSGLPLENGPGDNLSLTYAGPSGAFTYEVIVRIDFHPTTNFGAEGWGRGHNLLMQLISADADENANRLFQFRLAPIGTLNSNTQPLVEFINLNKGSSIQSLTALVPTTGPHAIKAGGWYHVAVSFNGKPDENENLKFYWTALDPALTSANLIGSARMLNSLPLGLSPDFAIGQTGRQSPVTPAPNNNFVGLIDEVRLSGIERSSSQMLFAPIAVVEKQPTSTNELAQQSASPSSSIVSSPAKPLPLDSNILAVLTSGVIAPKSERPAECEASTNAISTNSKTKISNTVSKRPTALGTTFVDGAIVRGPTAQARLAILFSCRDSDDTAALILKSLKTRQAKASFFVTSGFLKWPVNTRLVERLIAQGHYVAPASDDWSSLARFQSPGSRTRETRSFADVDDELTRLAALGVERNTMRYFLPTHEQLNDSTAAWAREWDLTMVAPTPNILGSSEMPRETSESSSISALGTLLERVQKNPSCLNGSILALELHSGSRTSDNFPIYFDEFLNRLGKHGYEMVRIDELLEGGKAR